ncbi:HTH_Tnp_Tc3_2 domain-containing protein [Trichonephila clavipes]|nr:HTH_Tnp_Tc3_2 domain-containing protein [Trichonephila clavipes]
MKVRRGYIGETCALTSNDREIDYYNSGGLGIWAGIHLKGRTFRYVFTRDSETAMRYRDDVSFPYVRLYTGAVDPDFILMDDNTTHIDLIWSMNFWKVRIFSEWIAQLDLQTSPL